MASQRPLSPLVTPLKLAVRPHDPASAHGNPSVPLLLSSSHLRWLGPRRHAKQQHLSQCPDVIGEPHGHRRHAGPPLLD